MTRRQVTTGLVVLAAVAAAVLLIRVLGPKGGGEEEIATDVGVHVGKIVRATLHRYVTAYGTVEPEPPGGGRPAGGAQVSAPVGGILTEIACTEGRPVERGALLFRLDTRLAEVAVAKAEKELAAAEQTYERQKKLLAADGTSQKSFQEAELGLATARSELATARTELALLEIRAPLAGTVVRIAARIGQAVEPNAVLAEVIALDRLVVTAQVPSRDAAQLKAGQPVVWGDGTGSAGEVLVVGRDVDPKTDTVLVRASLPRDSGLRPGTFLTVRIVAEERRGVLAVPEESVVPGPEGGPVLMMVEGDKAVPRPVKTSLKDAGLVEVAGEGLAEGQVVVTTDAYNITGETKIHLLDGKQAP
ncbi:MAG: efflux RND transporter periplasmic adaptor subunit [Candidatus Aminicenantes bacterium]|nr:efflux RND transporter periplasmic adaptor subunit [Candidatus Aminicenantes bacterium]NLH75704.1 efflux RND transporter periplasmic adaptor subunit [Acidobacteriota bacterium]